MTDKIAKKRNRARRERYASDDQYREQVNDRNRENYRKENDVELRDCASNINLLDGMGTEREIVGTGDVILTFSAAEVAEVLDGYSKQTVYRWLREGMLPPMDVTAIEIVKAKKERRAEIKVYSEAEMRVVVNIMSEHQQQLSYYTKKHTETQDKLYAAIDQVRGI